MAKLTSAHKKHYKAALKVAKPKVTDAEAQKSWDAFLKALDGDENCPEINENIPSGD
jgi:hypothetical protein